MGWVQQVLKAIRNGIEVLIYCRGGILAIKKEFMRKP
jgi:hypothetical protein